MCLFCLSCPLCLICLSCASSVCPVQVCECVVILRGLKDVSWGGAKAMMSDSNFLKSLVEYDKDSLSEKQVRGCSHLGPHTG